MTGRVAMHEKISASAIISHIVRRVSIIFLSIHPVRQRSSHTHITLETDTRLNTSCLYVWALHIAPSVHTQRKQCPNKNDAVQAFVQMLSKYSSHILCGVVDASEHIFDFLAHTV